MNIEREELTRIILEEIVCVKTNILESLMLSEKRRRNKNSARDQLKKDKDNLKNKVAERERTIRLRDRTIEELKDEIQNLNLKIRDREKAFEEYVDSEEKDLMRKINKVVSKLPTDQIRKRNKKVDQDFKKMEDLIDPERRPADNLDNQTQVASGDNTGDTSDSAPGKISKNIYARNADTYRKNIKSLQARINKVENSKEYKKSKDDDKIKKTLALMKRALAAQKANLQKAEQGDNSSV